MCEPIDPHDNHITVCVLKTVVDGLPNVRLISDCDDGRVARYTAGWDAAEAREQWRTVLKPLGAPVPQQPANPYPATPE